MSDTYLKAYNEIYSSLPPDESGGDIAMKRMSANYLDARVTENFLEVCQRESNEWNFGTPYPPEGRGGDPDPFALKRVEESTDLLFREYGEVSKAGFFQKQIDAPPSDSSAQNVNCVKSKTHLQFTPSGLIARDSLPGVVGGESDSGIVASILRETPVVDSKGGSARAVVGNQGAGDP